MTRINEKLYMKSSNNNIILTIETTSEICGVSIVKDNCVLYESNLESNNSHSVTLFNNINDALTKCKIDMSDVSIIKVSNGPGSFTGVRIGVATAIGLSEKYNTIIQYVDTLDSLAYNAIGKNDIIISLIDAKNDRVYLSLYDSKSLQKLCKDLIVNVYELVSELNKYFRTTNIVFSLVGSGAINYKKVFNKELKIKYNIFDKLSSLKASTLANVSGENESIPNINYLIRSKAEREKYGDS